MFLDELFTASGRIEGPGSTTNAYKLTGPLGPKSAPKTDPVIDIIIEKVASIPKMPIHSGEIVISEEEIVLDLPAPPPSGVPYAIRVREKP